MAGSEEPVESSVHPRPNYTFSQLMKASIESPRAIVDGLMYERQNVLFMGRFGIGKTMFGTQMGLSLALGTDFLGRKIPRPFKVQFIDCENDLGDIKNRLRKQVPIIGEEQLSLLESNWRYASADMDSPLYGTLLDTEHHEDYAGLAAMVAEENPDVLILDNLGLVAKNGDLKDPEEAKRFYTNLGDLRRRSPALKQGVIFIMHHLTKPAERQAHEASLLTNPYEFISRARGSGRVLDFAQGRFAIAEEHTEKMTTIVVNGINRSGSPVPLSLEFDPETLSFQPCDDKQLRFEQVFSSRPKGKLIYGLLPPEFTFSQAEAVKDPKTGKPFNTGTLSFTIQVAEGNHFLAYDDTTRIYRKVFHPNQS